MVERLQGKKVVGLKQTIKALKTGNCKKLYIAKDSDDNIRENIEGLAMESSIEVIYIDTMKELGRLCGIQVGAVAAATV
ncbi:ribosomal L7Ae/L30e/S12e/Gadd45 family protein [Clostridium cellulovorans]|uniref:Ribosomal protein L7Ae/L30e/S12e/Gadd45 n=1 Tax=Clostridium cellulovorans (strain ATCC 35296 / DSM 3052 / OCM 3 / 743B) TaxID=573061 RepID=D9SXA6_CLOC7|nr:ribosomal L7Ae/L30e/S12e/Gadd45 family protein [Clostridium cellulovorans]ADL53409.1 ribosomal protein L7Ae/L30e/S12e/Gadd45 [Clostridium cellulovorans 743B]